jgi:serine protease Do
MNASVQLLEAVVPASVALEVEVEESHPSAALLGVNRHGSGVFFDPSGLVLTANYVVLGARSITIFTTDDQRWSGRKVVQDFYTGLAVVRVAEEARFPALPLSTSADLTPGEDVFLIGAVAENGRRIHDGVISALEQFDAFWEYRLQRAIFTTAPSPGYGGGALIDRKGQVRGIMLLELSQIGRLTLAAPVDELVARGEEFLAPRAQSGRKPRGWLGLFCYSVGSHLVVAGVIPESPADDAGLKTGDVLLAVEGRVVRERGELYDELWQRAPGERVRLSIYRDKQVQHLVAQLGDAEKFFA